MTPWASPRHLTETQVALLRWIADGCPAGAMTGTSHRISAAALARRGLATIGGRRDGWTATITPAGRTYLQQVDGPNPPRPRRAEPLVSKQLVDEVLASGGSLRVPAHRWDPTGWAAIALREARHSNASSDEPPVTCRGPRPVGDLVADDEREAGRIERIHG